MSTGVALERQRRYAEATTYYRRVNPAALLRPADWHFRLGTALFLDGKLERAYEVARTCKGADFFLHSCYIFSRRNVSRHYSPCRPMHARVLSWKLTCFFSSDVLPRARGRLTCPHTFNLLPHHIVFFWCIPTPRFSPHLSEYAHLCDVCCLSGMLVPTAFLPGYL